VRRIILLDRSSLAIEQYDAMTLRSPINSYEVSILLIQSIDSFPIGPQRCVHQACTGAHLSRWRNFPLDVDIALNCRGACPFLAFFTLLG
jgi:hypothetical protein